MKVSLIMFETENSFKIVTKKVKKGVVKIKNELWDINKAKPYSFETKRMFGLMTKQTPAYVVTHMSSIPYRIEFESSPLTMKGSQPAKAKYAVTPETYSDLATQGAVNQLLKIKGQGMVDFIMWLLMGLAMGGMAGFIIAIMTPGIIPA